MNTAELKLKLFRHIDKLDSTMLEEVYGLISNYTKQHVNSEQWDELSEIQKKGIYKAIDELNNGEFTANEDVLSRYRTKYNND
ncbi:hypothetical protein [Carboxylicivirga sp. M1479]|uniref:hypothetical protein n=1 Tax=Carboxylicivirga sp. M1479 TaxID=2594476 RepID=UPI001177B38F|nr:hypothetical protein [Carboxylicivirga sp. M1479]TRX70534.1 hypothetical protein FNN09_11185 [Carboxylicivirga sp. M1479]